MKQVTKPTPSRMVTPRASARSSGEPHTARPVDERAVYDPSRPRAETFYVMAEFDWGSMIGPFRVRVPWNGTRGVTLCTGGRRRQNATDPRTA